MPYVPHTRDIIITYWRQQMSEVGGPRHTDVNGASVYTVWYYVVINQCELHNFFN